MRILMYVVCSCFLSLFRCSMYLLVCMYLCTHKLLLMLVICCKSLEAFICVGGHVIVVAEAYEWFNTLVWLLLYSLHVRYIRSFKRSIIQYYTPIINADRGTYITRTLNFGTDSEVVMRDVTLTSTTHTILINFWVKSTELSHTLYLNFSKFHQSNHL